MALTAAALLQTNAASAGMSSPGGDPTIAANLVAAAPANVLLSIGTGGETRDAALDCLATAISYEAGREPVIGQEAVAQVILNRARHRAFPKTVCGVVYQGSSRRTGCQFTFTCDGSLMRRRSPASLLAARTVAARVFDGLAGAGIGSATFYHADYVTPYWAPALARVGQIGAHIFYRFPGNPALATDLAVVTRAGLNRRAAQVERYSPRQVVFSAWGIAAAVVVPHDNGIEVRGR